MADGLRGDPGLWEVLSALPRPILVELAECAANRVQVLDIDHDFAVSYPHDCEPDDPHDEMHPGHHVPPGHLSIGRFFDAAANPDIDPPAPEPILESLYRDTLAAVLDWAGLPASAARVRDSMT